MYKATLLGGLSAPKKFINENIIIKMQNLLNNDNINLLKEILIHLILNSDQIIYKYIPQYIGTFRYNNKLGIAMQWSGKQNFGNFLNNNNFFNKNITSVLLQVSKILEIMQNKYDFIHGDFKPNNIMVYNFKKRQRTIQDQKINTYGYTVKIIDFGFSTMKAKKYIIKNNPYRKDIINKFYIDLLFLSINTIKILKKNKKTHFKIYEILHKMIVDLFKTIKININFYLKSNLVPNRKISLMSEFFKIDMVEYISKIDILYEIIDLTLGINNNDNSLFNSFYPKKFFLLISDALE